MIAVIFEAWPEPDHFQQYLDIAARLRPELEKLDGFISIERFESLSEKGKILSLSLWRDEESVARWREFEDHRTAQAIGRRMVFRDHRLKVASIIRAYGKHDREQAPG